MATRITQDARLNRSEGEGREDRSMVGRQMSSRELSDQERIDEFRQTLFQSALPDIPPIRGYHVCWLTTENPRDPIHARMRLGYEPVQAEDIPGWEHSAIKSGEWEGCIGINEMLAFKLPLHLYEAYMTENHYTQPNFEEEKLNEATRRAEEEASQVARSAVTFELMDGQAEIGTGEERLIPFAENLGEHVPDE